METIPESYRQAGYHMKLLKREKMAAMYADVSKSYFEVHEVRVAKARQVFGKDYPEREILAGNEDFGTYAWACVNEERAQARFDNILAAKEL